jgi:hypothetical protein
MHALLRGRDFHDPQLITSRPDSTPAQQLGDAFAIDRRAEVIAPRLLATGGDKRFCLRVTYKCRGLEFDPDQCNPVGPGQSFRHGATGKQRDSGARLPGDGSRDRHGSSLQPGRFGESSAGQAAVALPLLPANPLVSFFRCAIAARRRARADQRSCQWRLMCYRTLPLAIVRETLGTRHKSRHGAP